MMVMMLMMIVLVLCYCSCCCSCSSASSSANRLISTHTNDDYLSSFFVIICQGLKLTSRFVNPCGTTLTARGQRETERSARSQDVRWQLEDSVRPKGQHAGIDGLGAAWT